MTIIEDQVFDEERTLYGSIGLEVKKCKFDGPADGESAFKECKNIAAMDSYFNLRYPFWHDEGLEITNCEMTENCRAALWYSENIEILNTKLHGIKALRECKNIRMVDCDVISPEFGWFACDIHMENTKAVSEYFMLQAKRLHFKDMTLDGKYSFQYIEDSEFDHCVFNTKDAFWHAKNVVVRNSVVKGEYLAWYCENVTFDHCKISGTQPLCYCKGLKLIDCELTDADLCFEKSEVEATITTPVISIKNPRNGQITVPAVGEIIMDDERAMGEVIVEAKND